MCIINELDHLLLEQGWSKDKVVKLGYGKREKEGDEYYQDGISTELFSHIK
jgi:hypothetical protein